LQEILYFPGKLIKGEGKNVGLRVERFAVILYFPGKLIKGEGKNVGLRVERFAVSQIIGTDGLVISG